MRFDLSTLQLEDDGAWTGVWGPFVLRSGFQPIFKMGEKPLRIGAFEALVRPLRNGQPCSPWQFFKLVGADDGSYVENLTRSLHVLNASKVLGPGERLFLNFDPSMFTERSASVDALQLLDETLDRAQIDRRIVVCEVTEHRSEESALLDLVDEMRIRGFKVAVDDYGADDSDMARVQKLGPDIIKFDSQWIGALMDAGSAGEDLLHDMVTRFKEAGIETLFEGIEETWQLDLAVRCGVELVQGYVLARPAVMPCDFSVFRPKDWIKPVGLDELDPDLADFSRELGAGILKPLETPLAREPEPEVRTFGQAGRGRPAFGRRTN